MAEKSKYTPEEMEKKEPELKIRIVPVDSRDRTPLPGSYTASIFDNKLLVDSYHPTIRGLYNNSEDIKFFLETRVKDYLENKSIKKDPDTYKKLLELKSALEELIEKLRAEKKLP